MFLRTEVRDSKIFGKGLFAAQQIDKGTIICSFTLGAEVTTEDVYVEACAAARQPILRTGTRYAGQYFTFGNEQEPYTFINHSFKPNLLCHCGVLIALVPVETGKELTLDYRYLIDPSDIAAYDDAATGRPIRGFTARETMLRTARELVSLLESMPPDWRG